MQSKYDIENTVDVNYKGTTDIQPDFVAIAGAYAAMANRNAPEVRIMERASHEGNDEIKYDAGFIHDESRIAADEGTYMMYD